MMAERPKHYPTQTNLILSWVVSYPNKQICIAICIYTVFYEVTQQRNLLPVNIYLNSIKIIECFKIIWFCIKSQPLACFYSYFVLS